MANIDFSLQHIQLELQRIDLRVQLEMRRMQQAGQDIDDTLRGLRVTDADANALMARPFATPWGRTPQAGLNQQDTRQFAKAEQGIAKDIAQLIKQANSAGQHLRLLHLAEVFGLSQFALDAFLICLAPALDLRYERIFGYLHDDLTQKQATLSLILDLLCEPGTGRLRWLSQLDADSPLLRHLLLEAGTHQAHRPLLSQVLVVNREVLLWLLGEHTSRQGEIAAPTLLAPVLLTVDAAQLDEVSQVMLCEPALLVGLTGPDSLAQRWVAQYLAHHCGRPMLMVALHTGGAAPRDTSENVAGPPVMDETQQGRLELALRRALRDARLQGALLVVEHWQAGLLDDVPQVALWRHLTAHPLPVLLCSTRTWQARGVELPDDHLLRQLAVPGPNYAQCAAGWAYFLAQLPSQSALFEAECAGLASQFQLSYEQIRNAVSGARESLKQAPTVAQLQVSARAQSIPTIAGLAHQIQPRHHWADVVLPDDQKLMLREMIAMIRQRGQVLEGWGLGKKLAASHGVSALFAGPPGTGKTMSAEIIASELGIDLYRIDLSTMVSKYIGETEKNLEKIFTAAERSNAILFFDEADAIFGKRSEVKDAHDRYANMEVGYLLQRMERYDGVTILATNLRANLDEAFTRRLHFVIDFPFPDEVQRLLLWQTLFPPTVPRAGELDFGGLARKHKIAGGVIRNIVVGACYLAATDQGAVTQAHLQHAARRELQKMGRLQD